MMMQKANPKTIGIFILTAFFLFIATFLLVNQNRFFSKTVKYVMYFQGSIKGLNVGSPVVFNGVPVGRVIGISLVLDVKTQEIRIPVYIETTKNSFVVNHFDEAKGTTTRELTEDMIARGLRARLEQQSLLTGQMMIGLRFYPNAPLVLVDKNSKLIEIPTLPSTGEELLQTLQNLPLRETMNNLNEMLQQAITLINTVNKDSPIVLADLKTLTGSLAAAAKKAEKTFESFGEDSRTMTDLNKMLRDFSAAAQSLRNWADYLERHPEAMLKGKGSN